MNSTRSAASCRWAIPTVFLPPPLWLSAEDCPWTCILTGVPHVLRTTERCRSCPQWEPYVAERPARRGRQRSLWEGSE